MTLNEFLRINTWYELCDYCYDVDYNLRTDGIYDREELDDYLNDELVNKAARAESWGDLYYYLDNIPEDSYDMYIVGWDGSDEVFGSNDGDDYFQEQKQYLVDFFTSKNYFDEEEPYDESKYNEAQEFDNHMINGFIDSFNQTEGGI